jgi:Cu(I)/Ag(I) efflux system membrane fusion protein/cobalt-zinc-cadmium efflux system membrane fusion protein
VRRQQLIGVRTAAVERAAAAMSLRTVGLVHYDETLQADVNLKLEGWIRDLFVDYTGKLVQRGDPLFTLYSPELLTTQQEYLLALTSRDQLRASQIADAREYADRLVAAARQRILLWDIPTDQIDELETSREAPAVVTFRSPATGYVIEKQALQGMHVMPGQTLYKIADLSRVWIEADIYEQEVALVRVGQSAAVTLDAYPAEPFTGRAIYIYPFVEPRTRTVRVRFEFANRGGRLKPGMYANVTLQAPLGMSTTIPSNALLDSGSRQLVFVAEGDGYFQPRDVKVGHHLGDRVQILDGLSEGEVVAMGATFFLDSESQLRASVQAFDPAPALAEGGAAGERLDITFRSEPDPPRTGDNILEVSVTDATGQPIADADVSVTFFMAAMPTMNMPAMRNEARLAPAGGGLYRGAGEVMMGGRWDVTVTVSKDGQRLGSRQLAVVAR